MQVARLLHVLDRMRHSSKYRAFIKAPPPDAVFETDEGDQVYNRVIPLPIGLQNVQVSCCMIPDVGTLAATTLHVDVQACGSGTNTA